MARLTYDFHFASHGVPQATRAGPRASNMSDFHLCHVIPEAPWAHGLNGYQEIIESVRWGLEALGHSVSAERNAIRGGAVNVLFGAQMFSEQDLASLPDERYIVYNFEQLPEPESVRPSLASCARRFIVWDYSERNIAVWRRLELVREPVHAPIGWAPVLAKIAKSAREDIDVLFYGLPGDRRLQVFRALCDAGMKAVFACGLYGADRDSLIARSKVVLNVNQYDSRIFELARVSYLLANSKAVVADLTPETYIEDDIRDAVVLREPDRIVEGCADLLADPRARAALEARGHEIFRRRDIRAILRAALDESGI